MIADSVASCGAYYESQAVHSTPCCFFAPTAYERQWCDVVVLLWICYIFLRDQKRDTPPPLYGAFFANFNMGGGATSLWTKEIIGS